MTDYWTTDPPTEPGWYWIAINGKVQPDPASTFHSADGGVFILSGQHPAFRMGQTKETVHRSRLPLTPPLPPLEDGPTKEQIQYMLSWGGEHGEP